MPVLKEERETLIRLDHCDNTVHIYSTEPKWWRKCESLGMVKEQETAENGNPISRMYLGPLGSNRAGGSLNTLLGRAPRRPEAARNLHRDGDKMDK